MVTTVSLNPSIDKGVSIESFNYGSMNRVIRAREDAGGKAINVAVVLSELGIYTQCVGFLCRENSKIIEQTLCRHGVSAEWVWLDGSVRTNLKLLDERAGVVTEINESGPFVTDADLNTMTELIARSADDSDFLVLTGSLPPGCPKGYYAELIRLLTGSSCRLVLDAEGEALTEGIGAAPYLIKPNRLELELLLGRSLTGVQEVARAALDLTDRGVAYVGVSLGGEGALLASDGAAYFAPPLTLEVKSTVGAGDSMVAGMILGLMADMPADEVLRRGAACAAASIVEAGTKLAERARFKEMLNKITVERVRL